MLNICNFQFHDVCSSRIMEIQCEMTERCIELLEIPDGDPRLILDIGCGSGLSGECLDENGHVWVGLDISQSMLSKLKLDITLESYIT